MVMLNRKMQRGGVMKKLRARVSFPRRDGLCFSRGFRTRVLTLRLPHRRVYVFSILLFSSQSKGFVKKSKVKYEAPRGVCNPRSCSAR